MSTTKKDANKKDGPITGLTVRQLMGIDRAIDIVAPLSFPLNVGYNLGKIKGQLETRVKANNKNVNELREKLRVQKDKQWIIPDDKLDQWRKESEKLSNEVDNELLLRTFKFSDFDYINDDHYSDTKVPQEFITLMFPLLTE